MQLNSLSKKLILAIIIMTALAVYLAGQLEPNPDSSSQQNIQSTQLINRQHTNEATETQQKELEALLTNPTVLLNFSHHSFFKDAGLISPNGYAKYTFNGHKGQILMATLTSGPDLQLILFGSGVQILKSNESLVLPDDSLYELRVLYKDSDHKPVLNQPYKLVIKLK